MYNVYIASTMVQLSSVVPNSVTRGEWSCVLAAAWGRAGQDFYPKQEKHHFFK